MKHTTYGYQIKTITPANDLNWLFLPGGPGLGSAYLDSFCHQLKLPGGKLVIDFPMDGTNSHGVLDIKGWQEGLIDLLQTFPNSILVTHSFAGMFALFTPQLKSYIKGLVLMNTTTHNSFSNHICEMQQKYNLPDISAALDKYHADPSHFGYKEFWNMYKHYCFTQDEMTAGEEMMELFAYNHLSYNYTVENFYAHYESKWVPTSISTLTISSERDYICPPDTFIKNTDYNHPNILNRLIPDAGHCPWINHFEEVQKCFNELAIQAA